MTMSMSSQTATLASMSPPHGGAHSSMHIRSFQSPDHAEMTHEHKHSGRPSRSNSSTTSSVPCTPIRRSRASTIKSNSFSPSIEDNKQESTSDHDTDPLNSAIAERAILMTPEEESKAEHALEKHGDDWYERSGLFERSNNEIPTKCMRASSTQNTKPHLDSMDPRINAEDAVVDAGFETTKAGVRKPTAQEWVADIDCVSGVVGAMLADDDRGPR